MFKLPIRTLLTSHADDFRFPKETTHPSTTILLKQQRSGFHPQHYLPQKVVNEPNKNGKRSVVLGPSHASPSILLSTNPPLFLGTSPRRIHCSLIALRHLARSTHNSTPLFEQLERCPPAAEYPHRCRHNHPNPRHHHHHHQQQQPPPKHSKNKPPHHSQHHPQNRPRPQSRPQLPNRSQPQPPRRYHPPTQENTTALPRQHVRHARARHRVGRVSGHAGDLRVVGDAALRRGLLAGSAGCLGCDGRV
ncbi:uncharacterized protein B0H64DRAFT_56731 [Chaetomium fimeti]|uniref:Uncharacterized protein n=1 Tax=Chaetomium fimeti TaxID=1854472 RepID=A0AAE0LN56_9PEZI|nr:hypothetical protein B0H64DRAFT_56731 [Chaetomium fimeti]